MYHEIKCNSNEQKDYINLVAPYYNAINPTKIFFEKEKVIATIDSLGHIEFFDMEENSLGFVDFPVSDDPSEKGHTAQYGNAKYLADDNKIYFQLPIYDWRDYYPNCDGESDRWDRYVVRWFSIVFDCNTRDISVEGR